MVDDPKCSAVHIGKVIGKDAALTARLLKIVNSAFYRFPSRVETVSRAITIIGYRELRDLVFAATVSGMFERISTDIIDLDSFWRHGIYSGILSRLIADNCQVLHGERLFVAGLMHDIGQLIISYKLPKLMRAIMDLSDKEGIALYEAEAQILGFTHAEVGAELMKAWSFPETQQNVARYHHNPSAAKDSILEVNIVYLANIIAQIAETGLVDTDRLGKIDNKVWVMTKVSKSDVESLLVEAREQFIEALTLFRPKGRLGASNAA
jgi:HD-like signal output (HDOD) protein